MSSGKGKNNKMPILKDTRKIIEIKLKSIEGGVIQVYNGLLAADIDVFSETTGKPKLLLMLTKIIKEWNLQDEAGNVLPVSLENVGKIDIADINSIFSELDLTKSFLDKSL